MAFPIAFLAIGVVSAVAAAAVGGGIAAFVAAKQSEAAEALQRELTEKQLQQSEELNAAQTLVSFGPDALMYAKANGFYTRVEQLKQDPDTDPADVLLGQIAQEQQELEAAAAYFRDGGEALGQEPTDALM